MQISKGISKAMLVKNISTHDQLARTLGVMLDKHFSMGSQIKQICKVTHFNLCNIRAIRTRLTDNATELINYLITSRSDYCNFLLHGLPETIDATLQRVQNIVNLLPG